MIKNWNKFNEGLVNEGVFSKLLNLFKKQKSKADEMPSSRYDLFGSRIIDPLTFIAEYFGSEGQYYRVKGHMDGPNARTKYYLWDYLKDIEELERKQGYIEGWQIIALGVLSKYLEIDGRIPSREQSQYKKPSMWRIIDKITTGEGIEIPVKTF